MDQQSFHDKYSPGLDWRLTQVGNPIAISDVALTKTGVGPTTMHETRNLAPYVGQHGLLDEQGAVLALLVRQYSTHLNSEPQSLNTEYSTLNPEL